MISNAGEERDLKVKGLFYGIGHTPNSHLVEGQIELDDKGYVKVSASITKECHEPLKDRPRRCLLRSAGSSGLKMATASMQPSAHAWCQIRPSN